MSLFSGWRGWRQFKKLPWEWRNIVIYSESGQDWHQFSGLITYLNQELDCKTCYVTSDKSDPGLSHVHENFHVIYLPEGIFRTIFFQVNQSDVFVLTMMDLGNLQLKRSLHPVHYVYLFHSMGSTHMVDDHYDSLFCAGPHQVAEIRKREEIKNLPAKHLFDYGHPRLEEVIGLGSAYVVEKHDGEPRTVLIAPTWGETSIFNTCGKELIKVLLDAGYHVIMRPHYQSMRKTPEVIRPIRFSVPTSWSVTGRPWPWNTQWAWRSRYCSSMSPAASVIPAGRSWGLSQWKHRSGPRWAKFYLHSRSTKRQRPLSACSPRPGGSVMKYVHCVSKKCSAWDTASPMAQPR